MCDVLQSGGVIGSPYVKTASQQSKPIEVVFCNPDMIWKSNFARPRLGQGAFRESFQAVYKVCGSRPVFFVLSLQYYLDADRVVLPSHSTR